MIWMAVSADKYELPLAVADSAGHLAELIGSSEQRVRELCCKNKKRKTEKSILGYRIVKVEE